MGYELSVSKEHALVLASEKGVNELIKPLTKEVFLLDSYIAGITNIEDKTILDAINEGDKLTLQREKNSFDDNAILVLTVDKKKLGYVPEKDNVVFSRLMDAGKLIIAKVKHAERGAIFQKVGIGLYLVDF